jgi:cell division septation protein DedD
MFDQFDKRDDTYEVQLGGGSLFGLFCAVAVVCGLFFVFGYTLGRHAVPANFSIADANAGVAAGEPVTKPNPSTPLQPASVDGAQPPSTADLSAVESGRTPATATASGSTPPTSGNATVVQTSASTTTANSTVLQQESDVPATGPNASAAGQFVVQVFAGAKEDDAVSLAAALKARQYPVFVKRPVPTALDQLYRVQVGPYATQHEADEIRSRLAADGYSVIIKKADQ